MHKAANGSEERRQLTALFCDVVGATELSTNLDPEDYFDVVRAYHRRAADLVVGHGGHVAQFLGDGLLAYFGYPRALEDAAERAVRAGLAIVDMLGELNQGLERDKNLRLSLRIGIHTGPVVLGQTGGAQKREVLAMGETLNLAARLQAIAAADAVVVSADSERLVHGLFATESLGPQRLKGFSHPIAAYRVLAATGVRGRLDLVGANNLTSFIGRDREVRRLLHEWEHVRAGRGRVVVIAGEPGIGKSRLTRAFHDQVSRASHSWLEAQCSEWTENTAFYPVIELHRRLIGVESQDPPAERLVRLEAALRDGGLVVEAALPAFAALHGIELSEDRRPRQMSREAQRRKTLETLSEWLLRLARERPLVLLIEDVQWIDPSTAELVELLAVKISELPLLLLLTQRADSAPLSAVGTHLVIQLDRLAESEATRVIDEIAPAESLSRERVKEIAVRAEGVPLYLEELTKAVLESVTVDSERQSATGEASTLSAIPATLRDSLMARLDRLGPAKDLALVASVVGRQFSFKLLVETSYSAKPALRTHLQQLVESELVIQIGQPRDETYRFKHALIRDEAYQSLVRSSRREYHARVGEALERCFPEETATRPELAAHHFLEAGNSEKGVHYLAVAARSSVGSSANVEAVHHADRALEELAHWPASSTRRELELGLCTLRGAALIAIRGYASEEVQRTFARARELVSAVGKSPQLAPVLHGLWLFHMVRGDREATRKLADQLMALAENSEDATARLFALTVAGIQGFFEGQFQSAFDDIERAFALYEPELHSELAVTNSLGTAGVARANAATCLWFLGHPERARRLVREVIAAARAEGHPFTFAGVSVMGAMVFHLCRDPASARPLEEEALRVATEQGFPLWIGGALCGLGTTLAELGDFDGGMEQIREGLALFRATGAQTNTAFVLGGVAALCLAEGRLEEAESAVDEALILVERNLETFYAPELWRLKGEVTLARADERSAEALFRHALALARAGHAHSLELRAASSLARLAERRAEIPRGLEVLASAYELFSEGLDTPDLQDAQALLERLADSAPH
jgi:class 3 adenylate cyclase/predicted ATPase